MSVRRLAEIPGFGIDRVAAAAGSDPDVLRMENLDVDIPVPDGVVEATTAAMATAQGNSWLPFTGHDDLRAAAAGFIRSRGGPEYAPDEVVITSGEGDAMLDALFCLTDPGDEVVLTDPTYAGMLNRVRLVGAVPRLVPLDASGGVWRLPPGGLADAVTDRTRVVFVNSASFPSGWVPDRREWDEIAAVCRERDLWLLYWAAFEGVLFDGGAVVHPAGLPGMRERTVTVGSALEKRMIGWRIGWVAAPRELIGDIARVHIYNGLTPSGFAQAGALVALSESDAAHAAATAELERRRDETLRQLDGLPVVRSEGGWSLLLDVAAMGFDCADASARLLTRRVAATPMRGWGGAVADRHVRFVYSREPVERLASLGDRVRAALTEGAG